MKRYGIVVISVVIAAVFVLHAAYLAVVAEDAFISYRFASHLAGGHGLTWNIGAAPVEGYTNFLWVLLAAVAISLGLPVTVFSQAVGVAAGLATLVYVYRYARTLLGLPRLQSVIPCALLVLSGPFATWSTSGMEMTLFTFFVVGACYHWAAGLVGERKADGYITSVTLLAATLTRPEGLLIAAILLVTGWLSTDKSSRRYFVAILRPAAVYLVVVAAYVMWRFFYFGDLLPNTYYAKVAGSPFRLVRGAIYTTAFLVYFVLPWVPLLLVVWRKKRTENAGEKRSWRGAARANPALAVCLGVCFVFTLYVIYIGGDYMAMYRFFVPVLPPMYLLVAAFCAPMLNGRSAMVASALLLLGAAFTFVHSTPLDRALFPKPPRQHGHYGGVQTERWHTARLSLIGEFFGDNKHSGDESVATDAIGAISYYSGMTVYGFHGLVDPYIARRRAAGETPGLGLPGHEKTHLPYVLSLCPTNIMFSRLLTDEPAGYPPELDPGVAETLRGEYEPVSVWLDDEVNGEAGYFTFYRRRVPST